jgi:hypothetical protein
VCGVCRGGVGGAGAQVMTRKVSAEYSPEQVKDAFSVFASSGGGGGSSASRGYIRKSDLIAALATYGEDPLTVRENWVEEEGERCWGWKGGCCGVQNTEAEELVSHLETDAAGYIHYDEYALPQHHPFLSRSVLHVVGVSVLRRFVDVVLSDSLRRQGAAPAAAGAAAGKKKK